ncbi:MAG TPA: glycosyltransferase family 4 protein [Gemmatimonadaceae bacterium]|nr:glycosyltransferase family 4 protein [Gemmatimonadaceae bacterium]
MTPSAVAARRPRIMYLEANDDGTVGGSHQALFDLVRNLDRSRYEPVVVFYQDNVFVGRLRDAGVEVHVLEHQARTEKHTRLSGGRLAKLRVMVSAIRWRARFLREQRVALIHVNNSPKVGNDDWLPAARLVGVPIIAEAMGDAAAAEETNPVKRWLFRQFDHVIPISRYIADAVARAGYPAEKASLVYLGVDIDAYRRRVCRTPAEVRRELGVAPDKMLVAMVGNLRAWKGQSVVVEALTRMAPAVREGLHVLFIGAARADDAPYAQSLRDAAATGGVSHLVSFLGGRTDAPDLVNAADVALHASTRPEPFGLVVIEAMAVGKAVVAADSGGPAEILTSESGVTYDVRRPEQLAAALTRLVEDPGHRAALGAAALARVDEFSIHRTVEGRVRVYEKLLGKK